MQFPHGMFVCAVANGYTFNYVSALIVQNDNSKNLLIRFKT